MRIALITALASVSLLAACGDDGGSTPIDAPPTSSITSVTCAGATIAATVTAPGFAFTPMSTTISAGEIVQFTMPGEHTATSDVAGLFRVGGGATGCFRFAVAGTFPFHCEPHGFDGTIVVQ